MSTNLFGEEISQEQPRGRGPSPHQQMLRAYGQRRGFACRDCEHLVATSRWYPKPTCASARRLAWRLDPMRRILTALAIVLLLAGCTPEPPTHQPNIYQWQTTVDQGW